MTSTRSSPSRTAWRENDWEGWQLLTRRLGHRIQIVGDDLFVTNAGARQEGHRSSARRTPCLIKLNQIGTLTETLDAITDRAPRRLDRPSSPTAPARRRTRPSPTSPSAVNAGQIKTGAPSRTDRVAKYNQLLRIEEELFDSAEYLGKDLAFFLDKVNE